MVRKNCWFRRNFSLTGLYHIFSNYGESIWRPTVVGMITIILSTLFWLIQINPSAESSLTKLAGSSAWGSNFWSSYNSFQKEG
jgi:hypothetical protein